MITKATEEWETTNAHNTDTLTKAILLSVIFVAKHLLAQKAILLPWACHVFLQAYDVQYADIKSVKVKLELGESTVQFSSRWLLHQLILHLDVYLMQKCVHIKYGTVLRISKGCRYLDNIILGTEYIQSSRSMVQT